MSSFQQPCCGIQSLLAIGAGDFDLKALSARNILPGKIGKCVGCFQKLVEQLKRPPLNLEVLARTPRCLRTVFKDGSEPRIVLARLKPLKAPLRVFNLTITQHHALCGGVRHPDLVPIDRINIKVCHSAVQLRSHLICNLRPFQQWCKFRQLKTGQHFGPLVANGNDLALNPFAPFRIIQQLATSPHHEFVGAVSQQFLPVFFQRQPGLFCQAT